MSLLGVEKINEMTDCTKVLPPPITSFKINPPPPPSSSSTSSHATKTTSKATSTYSTKSKTTYTSTYTETTVHTVTSCAPTVTNCPAGKHVTTETTTYTTTWCPEDTTSGAAYPYSTGGYYSTSAHGSKPTTVVTAGTGRFQARLGLGAIVVGLALLL